MSDKQIEIRVKTDDGLFAFAVEIYGCDHWRKSDGCPDYDVVEPVYEITTPGKYDNEVEVNTDIDWRTLMVHDSMTPEVMLNGEVFNRLVFPELYEDE